MNKDEMSVYVLNPGLIGLLDMRVVSLQEEAFLLGNMFVRFSQRVIKVYTLACLLSQLSSTHAHCIGLKLSVVFAPLALIFPLLVLQMNRVEETCRTSSGLYLASWLRIKC